MKWFKKIPWMILAFILSFLPALPSFAYTGGLLGGRSFAIYNPYNMGQYYVSGDATDNNLSTSMSTNNTYMWARVDLGSIKTLQGYRLKSSGGGYNFQYGTGSYDAAEVPNINGSDVYVQFPTPLQVRYIQLQARQTTTAYIYEFDVFELDVPPNEVNAITTGPNTQDTINLQWNNPSDSDFKEVQIYEGTTLVKTVVKPGNTATITGLSPGTSKTYTLKTVDTSGNKSTGVSVTTSTLAPDVVPPGEVSNVQTTIFDDSIKISFTPPNDSDFVEVRVFKEGTLQGVVTSPGTYFQDYDLNPGTTYTYLMRSRDSSGNMSQGVTVQAETSYLPGTPTRFYGDVGSQKVTLHWDDMTWSDTNLKPSQGQGGYNVYQDGVKINSTPITTTNYEVTGLTDDTEYRFAVSSVDDLAHESPLSQEITLTPETRTIPAAPNVSYQPSHDKITLTWGSVRFATGYEIYKESSGQVSMVDQVFFNVAYAAGTMVGSTSGTSYTVDQDPSTTTTYSIVAVNELGSSAPATIDATTSAAPANINLTTHTSFSASDVFDSGISLASNFWPFLMLGLAFVVAPWIYFVVIRAAKTAKGNEETGGSNRGEGRELNRDIRMQLRKGEKSNG